MKYIVEPKNRTQFKKFLKNSKITDIMIGVEGLSHGIILKMGLIDINQYLKKIRIPMLSLKITRLFHEKELDNLKNILMNIELKKVKFIFYSDFSVYEIVRELGYQNKLVYDANTYMTNAFDANAYLGLNEYVVISNQISCDEIEYLLSKVVRPVILYCFGKSIIFYSRRPLIKNYFIYRNLSYKWSDKNYYLKEEYRKDLYHLYEDEYGCYLYEPKFYYLFEELYQFNNIDYAIISCADMKATEYEIIVNHYLDGSSNFVSLFNDKIYKGIMKEKSVLLKDEVSNNE